MAQMMDHQNIDVVILCGGKGTRLKEETEIKPKPMVEIGGKPILWHLMKHYSHYGFRRFILALGYKGESIKKFFHDYRFLSTNCTIFLDPNQKPIVHGSSQEMNWQVVCVDTGENTLKGGRIKRLESFIQSPYFHLTYGDGLSNVHLDLLEKFHLQHQKLATVTAVHPPSRFGEMTIENGYVINFEEKPQLTIGHINGGFFVFQKRILDYLSPDETCDLEFGILKKIAQDRELLTFFHQGFWQCMDTLRDVEYLNKLWMMEKPPWKVWENP